VNRKETAFIIVDSPLRLESDSNTLDAWSRNLNLAVDNNEQGFVSYYEYMAGYYPAGFTRDLDGNYAVVPASHMVLRSMIRSDQKSYVWFAPAGTRRGTVDNATAIGYIDSATGLFQSIAVSNNLRDVLYNGKVNPISVLSDSGITIYGQKTRSATTSALDRVNVARLVVYLRRQLDLIARQYIFEPNDEITRREIKNQIEKELNSIKVNRGLYDYAVVCDTSNNTPDRIDRNELWVDVAIEPVKAVEFIYIPVRIKNTGDIQAGL
jgi:phage tail sheath protein FI